MSESCDDLSVDFIELLRKNASIKRSTIQSLIDNGFDCFDSFLALDFDIDLPQLTDISIGQRSLLRNLLTQFRSDENKAQINCEKCAKNDDLVAKMNAIFEMNRKLITDNCGKCRQLSKQLTALTDEINDKKEKIFKLEKSVCKVRKMNVELEKQIDEMEKQIDEMDGENKRNRRKLRYQFKVHNRQLNKMKTDIEKLDANHVNKIDENESPNVWFSVDKAVNGDECVHKELDVEMNAETETVRSDSLPDDSNHMSPEIMDNRLTVESLDNNESMAVVVSEHGLENDLSVCKRKIVNEDNSDNEQIEDNKKLKLNCNIIAIDSDPPNILNIPLDNETGTDNETELNFDKQVINSSELSETIKLKTSDNGIREESIHEESSNSTIIENINSQNIMTTDEENLKDIIYCDKENTLKSRNSKSLRSHKDCNNNMNIDNKGYKCHFFDCDFETLFKQKYDDHFINHENYHFGQEIPPFFKQFLEEYMKSDEYKQNIN